MTMLYTITSSATGKGTLAARGNVYAVETKGTGHAAHLNKETGKLCEPDANAVRDCMPYAWRAAWDRSAQSSFIYTSEHGGDKHRTCYRRLYRSNGKYLTTIYAMPYYFTA